MIELTVNDPIGYFWFRHHGDASTFIACRDIDGYWYLPGLGQPIVGIEANATLLGAVPRRVASGASIDQ